MKFIFIFFFVLFISCSILIIKSKNNNKINSNGAKTTGKIIKVFSRGKLPFCKYTYTVNKVNYTKKQSLPKQFVKTVLNKSFTVSYEISNPKNSILNFK